MIQPQTVEKKLAAAYALPNSRARRKLVRRAEGKSILPPQAPSPTSNRTIANKARAAAANHKVADQMEAQQRAEDRGEKWDTTGKNR